MPTEPRIQNQHKHCRLIEKFAVQTLTISCWTGFYLLIIINFIIIINYYYYFTIESLNRSIISFKRFCTEVLISLKIMNG